MPAARGLACNDHLTNTRHILRPAEVAYGTYVISKYVG
jgi:hypothetical protein